MRYLIVIFLLIFLQSDIFAGEKISVTNASKYLGKEKTVCGFVVSIKYAKESKGQPTFLNLEKPYPQQVFTVLIWGKNRSKFKNPPEELYGQKMICVKGIIKLRNKIPQIIVTEPKQITIE